MKHRDTFFLYLIFFPAGLGILSNPQRYPELKNQLHLSNGEFGTYISLVGIGSVICFILGSRMIHSIGIGRTFLIAMVGLYSSVAAIPHVHSPRSFIWVNIIFGFMSTLMHISMNAQGIHAQHKLGRLILPFLAGMWSAGAVSASLISSLVSKKLTLAWHMDLVAAIAFIIAIIGLIGSRNDLLKPQEEYEAAPRISFKNIMATFKFVPALSFGHILIVQSEFSAADWSAIYARNTIGVSVAQSSLCYLVFMITMASLRLAGHRINHRYSEQTLIKWVPRIGAVGFGAFILLATTIASEHRALAFVSSLLAYAFLGFGNSFMVLLIFGIAARKTNVMPSVVIASLGLVGASLSFVAKFIISWVAQATNLTVALLIPTLMLYAGSVLYKYGSEKPKLY
ncbi:MAG: hypothetical protein RL129_670 [Actinomycetota bacterium]|jgi:MFS family permease